MCHWLFCVFFEQHSQLVTYVVLMVLEFKGSVEYWWNDSDEKSSLTRKMQLCA
jgi:hypothetical protein